MRQPTQHPHDRRPRPPATWRGHGSRWVAAGALVAAAVSVSGCTAAPSEPVGLPSGRPASLSAPPSVLPSSSASPAGSGPVTDRPKTAVELLAQLHQVAPTVELVRAYTEETDPNHLLGRPHGYLSKVVFSDSRITDVAGLARDAFERGGSIEVFRDQARARQRVAYLQRVRVGQGLGEEHDYVQGSALLRVTGKLPAPAAARLGAAWRTITSG